MKALYRRYRPKKFSEVIGQNHVTQTLQNQVKNDKLGHAYLLVGTRGVGKTTVARLLATASNCLNISPEGEICGECDHCQLIENGQFPDIIEIDAASHTGVDNIRTAIVEAVRFAPMQGAKKVFIIDEVHMLSQSAFNALLKTLEEPPAHALFILATTEFHKVPETITSRCQRYFFQHIPEQQIFDVLTSIANDEGRSISNEGMRAIARAANGSLRDGQRTLEQVFGVSDGVISVEDVQRIVPVPSIDFVFSLLHAALEGRIDDVESSLASSVSQGISMQLLREDLVELLRQLILAGRGAKNTPDIWKTHALWATLLEAGNSSVFESLLQALAKPELRRLDIGVPYLGIQLALLGHSGVQTPHASPAPQAPAPVAVPSSSAPSSKPEPTPEPSAPANPRVSTKAPAPEAEPATAPEPDDTPVESATSLSLEELQNKWGRCCEVVSKHSVSLPMVLKTAIPAKIEGDVVDIRFERKFHYDTISDSRNLQLLTDAVCEVMQCTVSLRPVFEKKEEEQRVDDVLNAFGGRVLDDALGA